MQPFSTLPPTPSQSDVFSSNDSETPSRMRGTHRYSRYSGTLSLSYPPHNWASPPPNSYNMHDQLNAILASQKQLIEMYHASSERMAQNEKKIDNLEKKIGGFLEKTSELKEKVDSVVSEPTKRISPKLSVSKYINNVLFLPFLVSMFPESYSQDS